MRVKLAVVVILVFLLAPRVSAHRLDEYLQAATFSVGKDSVTLEMRLTPGVKVSRSVIAAVDTDRDGVLSAPERRAYVVRVRRDLRLTVDGVSVPLRLESAAFPTVAAMKDGVGEIILRFGASPLPSGSRHRLVFEDRHRSDIGVYLVNCLFPSDPDIRVTAQVRNYRQSFYRLDYTVVAPAVHAVVPVNASRAGLWLWLTAGVLTLSGSLAFLWRHRRQGTPLVTPKGRSGPLIVAALGALILCSRAAAHPLSQGSLTVRTGDRSLAVHARVTAEEVAITDEATGLPTLIVGHAPEAPSAVAPEAFTRHASYLAAHLRIVADGVTLAGRVVRIAPPTERSPAMAEYDLNYPLPHGFHPRTVTLYDDVLSDGHFPPGAGWETTYVVDLETAGGPAGAGFLLTRDEPLRFPGAPRAATAPSSPWSVFGAYFSHGVRHILTGYDHLLFISALVLAAVTLWDLVKVVTAFTLAHTLTLTLATLGLVHLSGRVVEPLISASIVFVAVQNALWPDQARGWSRLAAAFFFGLFHGLGFAGGLLDAMRGMAEGAMMVALLAFSLGVEVGHQMVVAPLYTLLRAARHVPPAPAGRERLKMSIQRGGSAVIAVAGLYYFFLALAGRT